jgi:hypothetical protein
MRSCNGARRHEYGLTLVETLIGLALVAGLALTVTLLIALARNVTSSGRRQLLALTLARAKLEQLQGLAFSRSLLPSGGTVDVTDLVTDLSGDRPSVGGAGLADSPADALVAPRAGYFDYLDAQGRWIGAGADDWRRAAFVRRWTVRRVGSGGGEWVAFEVLVSPLGVMRNIRSEDLLSSRYVIRLVGARARRAL